MTTKNDQTSFFFKSYKNGAPDLACTKDISHKQNESQNFQLDTTQYTSKQN